MKKIVVNEMNDRVKATIVSRSDIPSVGDLSFEGLAHIPYNCFEEDCEKVISIRSENAYSATDSTEYYRLYTVITEKNWYRVAVEDDSVFDNCTDTDDEN